MDPTDLAAGIDRGQDETDEALLQKMEQEQNSDAGSVGVSHSMRRPYGGALPTRLRELRDNNPMNLTDAAKYLGKITGRKPHVSTLWRWCQKGCKGVRLDSICVGGKRFVTVAGIERFIDESTAAQDLRPASGNPASPAATSLTNPSGHQKRCNDRRRREIEAARHRLDELTGISKPAPSATRSA